MVGYVSYLTARDYRSLIEDDQLYHQILDYALATPSIIRDAERWAFAEIKGKLSLKYDLASEFTPTLPYVYTRSYGGGSRVVIDFPDWISEKEYFIGDCIIFDNNGFVCLVDNNDSEFNSSKWQGLGVKYDIYSVAYPFPKFQIIATSFNGYNNFGYYQPKDKVYWNDGIYENLVGTMFPDHDELIQYWTYSNVPYVNVYPNDPASGKSYWKFIEKFVVSAGDYPTLPTPNEDEQDIDNPPSWILGDNRDADMVEIMLSLSIFYLHHLVSPQNIPDHRRQSMIRSQEKLRSMIKDNTITSLAVLLPSPAEGIVWGSNVKQRNGY